MTRWRCVFWLLCLVAVADVRAQPATPRVQTLLVPRASALDLVDPGSGLLLASIPMVDRPLRAAVAPDGHRAAVLGCRESTPGHKGRVSVSIVDLVQPRELRRLPIDSDRCPGSLAWTGATLVSLYDPGRVHLQTIDTETGAISTPPTDLSRAGPEGRLTAPPAVDPRSVAVQQFVADGGRIDDLALAPVAPRATCHACNPGP